MTKIEWDESYSVGVPELDDQHKVLIGLINRLDQAGHTGDDLREILDRLDWYVREHFSLEERLMREAGYAGFEAHAEEHKEFENWLASARSHMATGGMGTSLLAKAVNDHLREWLVEHILVADMAYKSRLSGASGN